jgi:hypothetical protein
MAHAPVHPAPEIAAPRNSQPLPLGWRIAATFTAPARLFASFREREQVPWVGPLLISIAIGIFVIALLPDEVFSVGMEHAVTRRGAPVEITSDAATIATWERIRLAFGVAVSQPVLAGVIASLLMLVFTTLLKGEARYQQYLAVTTHGFLISALGALIALPFQRLHADPELRISPALPFPGVADSGFAGRLLDGINVFSVWMLVVMAIGVSVLNRQHSRTKTVVLMLGFYLAMVGSLAAIGS